MLSQMVQYFFGLRLLKTRFARQITWSIAALLLFGLFFYISRTGIDPDFGWHLKSGQYIFAHGLPKTDIFTFTAPQFHWVNHEWLSDVITAKLYGLGGYATVAAFFAGLWTTSVLITSRKLNLFVLLIAASALSSYVGIRPVVWSLLFIVILIRLVESNWRYTNYVLPLLFLAWANLHGGWLLGLALLMIYKFILQKDVSQLIILLCLSAILINPYGAMLYIEVTRTVFDVSLKGRINEWRSLSLDWDVIIYLTIFWAAYAISQKKLRQKKIAVPGLFTLMTIAAKRYSSLFVVATIGSLVTMVETIGLRLKSSKNLSLVFSIPLSLALITIVGYSIWKLAHSSVNHETNYPKASVAYLQTHPCSGNLFNSYDYGGYLIWKLPDQKVYIDGRMPSWQTGHVSYMRNYLAVLTSDGFRRQEFDKFDIRCVLIKQAKNPTRLKNNLVANLKNEGWTEAVVENNRATLLIKPE